MVSPQNWLVVLKMIETICLIITAFSAVSREIRGWIEVRTREKDDEKHPPFLTLLSRWDNILYLTR